MPEDRFNSAAARLLSNSMIMGSAAHGVKPGPASPAAPSAPVQQTAPQPTPQAPQPAPQSLPLGAPPAAPPQAAPQKTAAELFAIKDRALADEKAKTAALEQSNHELIDRFTAAIETKIEAEAAAPAPEPEPLPENFSALPEAEQLKLVARREAKSEIAAQIDQERKATQKALAPFFKEHKENKEWKDKGMVREMYPDFPFETHWKDVQKQMDVVPGQTVEEAAILVAHYNPDIVSAPAPQAPATLPAVPSMGAATVGPGQGLPAPQGPSAADLLGEARKRHLAGDRAGHKVFVMEGLKAKGVVPANLKGR